MHDGPLMDDYVPLQRLEKPFLEDVRANVDVQNWLRKNFSDDEIHFQEMVRDGERWKEVDGELLYSGGTFREKVLSERMRDE